MCGDGIKQALRVDKRICGHQSVRSGPGGLCAVWRYETAQRGENQQVSDGGHGEACHCFPRRHGLRTQTHTHTRTRAHTRTHITVTARI